MTIFRKILLGFSKHCKKFDFLSKFELFTISKTPDIIRIVFYSKNKYH